MNCNIETAIKNNLYKEDSILLFEDSGLKFYYQPAIPAKYIIKFGNEIKTTKYSFTETVTLFKKYLKDRLNKSYNEF